MQFEHVKRVLAAVQLYFHVLVMQGGTSLGQNTRQCSVSLWRDVFRLRSTTHYPLSNSTFWPDQMTLISPRCGVFYFAC